MRAFIGFTMALISFACFGYGDAYRKDDLNRVSLVNLISTPEKYHKKMVRVIGAGRLEFEGNAICLSKEDIKFRVSNNCLWMEVDPESIRATQEELEAYNGKYILIEGVFNLENTGHMGMNSGAIEKINRYDLWERR